MAGRNEPRSAAGRERARKRREEKSTRGQPRSSSPNQKRLAVLLLVVVAVFYALGQRVTLLRHVEYPSTDDSSEFDKARKMQQQGWISEGEVALLQSRMVGWVPEQRMRARVAFMITITSESDGGYLDGAAVLAESARRSQSDRWPIDMVALMPSKLVKADSQMCRVLRAVGYDVRAYDYNITVDDIKGPLAKHIVKSGCCGMAELVKFGAFSLVDYEKVLILDADAVILKNMDELFDSPKEVTYAYDFLVGAPNGCIQGGFVLIKPSIRTMHQFLGLIREGDWGKDGGMGGWGDTSIGYCYGGPTFQGLIPFYYEASRYRLKKQEIGYYEPTVYNQMVGSPAQKTASLSIIKSVHFTNCQKPWSCNRPAGLCTLLHQEWWKMLHFMEETQKIPSQSRHGLFEDGCQGGYRPVDWDSVHPP